MAELRKLGQDEVRSKLKELPGWTLCSGKLRRELTFDGFVGAFGFMASVALVAESMNHHPEWSNVYNRVVIDLATHDIDGISERDFALAQAVNRLSPVS